MFGPVWNFDCLEHNFVLVVRPVLRVTRGFLGGHIDIHVFGCVAVAIYINAVRPVIRMRKSTVLVKLAMIAVSVKIFVDIIGFDLLCLTIQ